MRREPPRALRGDEPVELDALAGGDVAVRRRETLTRRQSLIGLSGKRPSSRYIVCESVIATGARKLTWTTVAIRLLTRSRRTVTRNGRRTEPDGFAAARSTKPLGLQNASPGFGQYVPSR